MQIFGYFRPAAIQPVTQPPLASPATVLPYSSSSPCEDTLSSQHFFFFPSCRPCETSSCYQFISYSSSSCELSKMALLTFSFFHFCDIIQVRSFLQKSRLFFSPADCYLPLFRALLFFPEAVHHLLPVRPVALCKLRHFHHFPSISSKTTGLCGRESESSTTSTSTSLLEGTDYLKGNAMHTSTDLHRTSHLLPLLVRLQILVRPVHLPFHSCSKALFAQIPAVLLTFVLDLH